MIEVRRRARGWSGAFVVALVLGGCGGTSTLPGFGHHHSAGGAVGQHGPAASTTAVDVVKQWSRALARGRVQQAASLFDVPSLFSDGPEATFQIRSLAQAEAANASLTCGASFISAFQDGAYVNVLFRLTARAGVGGGAAACGTGVGQTARTRFLIRGGRIVEWLRAPSQPGDPGVPGSPTTPTAPSTGGGSVV